MLAGSCRRKEKNKTSKFLNLINFWYFNMFFYLQKHTFEEQI